MKCIISSEDQLKFIYIERQDESKWVIVTREFALVASSNLFTAPMRMFCSFCHFPVTKTIRVWFRLKIKLLILLPAFLHILLHVTHICALKPRSLIYSLEFFNQVSPLYWVLCDLMGPVNVHILLPIKELPAFLHPK